MRDRGWAAVRGWETPGFDDHEWSQVATLRGAAMSHASSVLLRSILPPGTTHLRLPLPATGEYAVFINGQLLERRLGPPPTEGELDISRLARGQHDLIAIEVASLSDLAGLSAPLQVRCGPTHLERLEEWKALGLWWYAGRARYRTTVRINAAHAARRTVLDLGAVGQYAEVWINGQLAGTLLWPPYILEIGRYLCPDENEIVIIVSNSLANRFLWDQWGDSRCGRSWRVPSRPETSGLLGPAIIRTWK